MNAEFKKQVLKQLEKTMNELDKLLKIEGSLTDIRDLPRNFAGTAQSTLDYFVSCKEQIQDDRVGRPQLLTPRVRYFPPFGEE